ncbi:PASTA domain-containing protein [Streptosporangium lutulentum]
MGISEAEARSKLAEAGLAVNAVKKQASETVPRGQVMRTSPAVGNLVKEGSKVGLIMSAGLLTPDFKGMPRDQADGAARSGGFVPEFVEQTDAAQPCTVIAQDPQPNAEIDKGAAIRLTLSQCNNPEWHWPWENNGENATDNGGVVSVMPNVLFKDIQAARGELQAAGFKVKIKRVWAGEGSWPRCRRPDSRFRPARRRPSGSEPSLPGTGVGFAGEALRGGGRLSLRDRGGGRLSLREPCRRMRARPPSGWMSTLT